MSYNISESVSQRGDGAYDEENRRIQEVSNEPQRLCRLYEEESREGKRNGGFKYLNQFHKKAVERKLKKIEESLKEPMDPVGAAKYMWRNFEITKNM